MKGKISKKIEALHFSNDKDNITLKMLKPAAYLYGELSRIRRELYRKKILKSHGSGCYTIAVGNLTYGGTGKTPVVINLAEHLIKRGYRVGVIHSGYGSQYYRSRKSRQVEDSDSGYVFGDEATEIFVRVKDAFVYSSRNRVEAIERAIKDAGINVCILDDAFQHLKVSSDLNVVVVDFFDRFGNGECLPAGPLREPLSAIKEADIIWFVSHKDYKVDHDVEASFLKYNQNLRFIYSKFRVDSIIRYEDGESIEPDHINGNIISFSGIGREERFTDILKSLNLKPVTHISFGDHHRYTERDIERIRDTAHMSGAEFIFTTEKDILRDRSIVKKLKNLCVLRIGIDIIGGDQELERICEPSTQD